MHSARLVVICVHYSWREKLICNIQMSEDNHDGEEPKMSEYNHDGEEPKIPKVLHFCHPENLFLELKDHPGSRVQAVIDMGMDCVFHLKSGKPLNATITDYMVHNFEYVRIQIQ